MRATRSSLAAACLLILLPGTSAAELSLGANLGLTVYKFSNDKHVTTLIEWPASAASMQPGLRVGFRPSGSHHEVYLNTGLEYESRQGSDAHEFEATANYQYSLSPDAGVTPYATAGGGLISQTLEYPYYDYYGYVESVRTATLGVYGGGLGVAFRVANGAGRLRAEARYDRVPKGDRIYYSTGLFGIRLGFDLWMK